jgi:rRNA processing protein Krr1/Pno1
MIIGKGGETIREMQNTTGCKINVSQSSGPGEVEREIGLVGSRDAITRAKRAIEDKVDAAVRRDSCLAERRDSVLMIGPETEERWRWWSWPRTGPRTASRL